MSTEKETVELKEKGSEATGLAAEEKRNSNCFSDSTPLRISLLFCSLILIMVAIVINDIYTEYPHEICVSDGDAELWHYTIDVPSVMIDKFF